MNLLALGNKEYTDEEARKLIEYVAEQLDGRPQSKDTEGNCVYRGYNDARCAVGVLIPDSVYKTGWDESNFGINKVINELGIKINNGYLILLGAMQDAHDTYDGVIFKKESFISRINYVLMTGSRGLDWR